jgi:hypothetical protein
MSPDRPNMADGPESVVALAWRINALITDAKVRDRFRGMTEAWHEDHLKRRKRHDERERQREAHFKQRVARKPRLRDKATVPPGPDWEWEHFVYPVETLEGGRRTRELETLEVWVPLALTEVAEPDDQLPLPMPHRRYTLSEKYTVLAAVRDRYCDGVESLDRWYDPSSTPGAPANEARCGNLKQESLGAPYHELIYEARRLGEEDVDWLADILREVEADLASSMLPNAKHSRDFRSVRWFGTAYSFTGRQAQVVEILWDAWEQGAPEVGEGFLCEKAGQSGETKLTNLFRDHPAGGTMIVDRVTDSPKKLQPFVR